MIASHGTGDRHNHSLKPQLIECGRTLLGLYKQANAGHIGSSLSCLQILVDLAFKRMKGDDTIILSKGHAAAALYTVLAQSGRMPKSELETFYKDGTRLAAHPPCGGQIPGIPFGTGSLGHGLSLAAGLVLSQRFTEKNFSVYCLVSEGDCNEGSTWEAALFAAHQKLSNLVVIVDANGLQGFGSTEKVMNLEPLDAKWQSFGFETLVIPDGNSLTAIDSVLSSIPATDKPKCVIARTQKGFGVSYMANKMEWHYLPMSDTQYEQAVKDLISVLERSDA